MIKVEDLNVSYYGNKVVSDVSFQFGTSSLIGIIGPNGAGKSTMIKGMLGLVSKDKGRITIDGESIDDKRKEIAYVPQNSRLDWDFPINVFDTVLMGTYPSLGLFKRPGEKERKLAKKSLERVGMYEYAERQIGELSGGQQQRVFLARALTQEADIFFLDEPFVGIDISSEQRIMNILKELQNEGKIIFVVSHDLSTVESYFNNLILINKHLIKAGPTEDVFNKELIAKAYGMEFNIPESKEGEK